MRLVTLTGPGGTGKTRLGLQAASMLLDDFPAGVYFVGLASISDPALVPSAIAQSLGVHEAAGQTLSERLKSFLRERQLLLLLDNFEQIITAAPLIGELLAAAPGLKVIITSRIVLKLYGEHGFAVPPLDLPSWQRLPPFEQLVQYEAPRLFIERAMAIKSNFVVTNENSPVIVEICRRLDGLPLAIELAAARIKILSPKKLLEKLDNRLNTLVSGARDVPTHQQTLRGTLDWSYDLLNEDERKLFTRLAVFAGGCRLEAAETVCGAAGDFSLDVLDILASLVDENLLKLVDGADGEPRFVMLETIREYGLEKLKTAGETEAFQLRHAEYFLTLAQQENADLQGFEQTLWLDRLDEEYDNFRATLRWAIKDALELAVQLSMALHRFWEIRGYLSEGRRYLETILIHSDKLSEANLAAVLSEAGRLAQVQSNHQQAVILFERCVGIRRKLGNKEHLAWELNNLGFVFSAFQNNYTQAIALHEESLALGVELDNKQICQTSLYLIGQIARQQRDYERAEKLLAESRALVKELGNKRSESNIIHNLAWMAIDQHNYERATELINESLNLARQTNDEQSIILYLEHLGMVKAWQGKYAEAMGQIEEGLKLARRLGYKSSIAACLNRLGQIEFRQQNYLQAVKRFSESLYLYRELENNHEIVRLLWWFINLTINQDNLEQAARLIGATEALTKKLNIIWYADEATSYDKTIARVRASLDEKTFTTLWAAGQTLTLDQVIAEVST